MARASRRVCIAPKETSSVVASDAGWLAFRSKVPSVVSVAAITTAPKRWLETMPAPSTLGAAQAFSR